MGGRDSFSEKYMGQEGEVLYRDKLVGRWPWQAALLSPMLVATLIGLFAVLGGGGSPIDALAGGAFLAAPTALVALPLWLLFSVLRVTVTTRTVDLKFGLYGPEIPIESIVECRATAYDWKEFGGFGIRYSKGRWLYNMIGDRGQAVEIQWNDGGALKTTLVASHDNIALAKAINQARAMADRTAPAKVRVAEDLDDEHEEEVEAARERLPSRAKR